MQDIHRVTLNTVKCFLFFLLLVINTDDPEEMVIPGDKQEMEDFIEKTINNCEMRLDVYLPIVTLQLVSKHIYEVIYNRINSDLLLWIPSAPKPKISNINLYECTLRSLDNLTTLDNTPETFAMCKSGIQYGNYAQKKTLFLN